MEEKYTDYEGFYDEIKKNIMQINMMMEPMLMTFSCYCKFNNFQFVESIKMVK